MFLAADGMVAIEELKKRHYDVVLTDYQMPRLNGLELLTISQELMPETPVILISQVLTRAWSRSRSSVELFAWIRKPGSRDPGAADRGCGDGTDPIPPERRGNGFRFNHEVAPATGHID